MYGFLHVGSGFGFALDHLGYLEKVICYFKSGVLEKPAVQSIPALPPPP